MQEGYGRFKPDIVVWATGIVSSNLNGGCNTMSGTSAASPIVTGSIALLIRYIRSNFFLVIHTDRYFSRLCKWEQSLNVFFLFNSVALSGTSLDRPPINPASLKQAILAGADPLVDSQGRKRFSIFEQGAGLLNLKTSLDVCSF